LNLPDPIADNLRSKFSAGSDKRPHLSVEQVPSGALWWRMLLIIMSGGFWRVRDSTHKSLNGLHKFVV
jgi:hypothetical protein